MDETSGQDERDRLEQYRLAMERGRPEPRPGWRGRLDRAREQWTGFRRDFGRQRRRQALAGLLVFGFFVVAVALFVASVLGGDGGDASQAAAQPTRGPTVAQPTATAPPAATETPLPEATQAPAVRLDCDELRGGVYSSDAERSYFLNNCITPEPGPPTASGVLPATLPPAQPTSPPPPPPPDAFDAGDAIALAVQWIRDDAPKSYTTEPAFCSAVNTGAGRWVVTCDARLAGCQRLACDERLSVCVFDTGQVRSADQC